MCKSMLANIKNQSAIASVGETPDLGMMPTKVSCIDIDKHDRRRFEKKD